MAVFLLEFRVKIHRLLNKIKGLKKIRETFRSFFIPFSIKKIS